MLLHRLASNVFRPPLRAPYPRPISPSKVAPSFVRMASTLSLPDSRALSYSLDSAPSDAPVVLLSNSLCAPYHAWDRVVALVNKAGFRTLRYDQPGHGKSSAPKGLDTTFDSMTDDVHHLLKSLNISKLHGWIGVSMGAAAGIRFTTKFPNIVSKLVVCDTISCSPVNAGLDDVFGPRVAAAREAGNLDGIAQATRERWFGTEWLEKNPEEAERVRKIMHGTTVDGFETCCHALRSKTFDLRPLFAKVGASVDEALLVVGEKDANLPETMEVMRGEIEEGFKSAGKAQKVELIVIKDAGHVCFIDGLEQFTKSVIEWL